MMVTRSMTLVLAGLTAAACGGARGPNLGAIGETPAAPSRITAVDSAVPPHSVSIQLDQPAYTVVLLVAPGHSATLLYPVDSTTDNRLQAGSHTLSVNVPEVLVMSDSAVRAAMIARARDTTSRVRQRPAATNARLSPILPTTPTYLLVVTSPQALTFQRITAKTVGVSIPIQDLEALNAVGKAIKSTIVTEPREWHGFYHEVALRKPAS